MQENSLLNWNQDIKCNNVFNKFLPQIKISSQSSKQVGQQQAYLVLMIRILHSIG